MSIETPVWYYRLPESVERSLRAGFAIGNIIGWGGEAYFEPLGESVRIINPKRTEAFILSSVQFDFMKDHTVLGFGIAIDGNSIRPTHNATHASQQ